jgi:predicted transposase YdaD
MLKHAAHDPAFDGVVERLSDHLVAAASEPGGVEALVSTLYYAYENSDLRRGVIESLIAPHLDPKAREAIVSTAQKLREEGREEGRVEGRVEGRTEGKASMVQTALRFKFGELPDAVLSRVQSADANQLERWLERIFVAQSLDDVFAD